MSWWLVASAAMSVGSSFMGFSMGRREDKTHLQKLHQDKLLTRYNTVSNTNIILDTLKSAQSDNITVAGTANYHAFDSASFKAIQKRMTTLADKDIKNLELTNQIAISGINTSISNLNFNMRMKEFKLFMDVGSTVASTNYYMKDQATEVATRQAEIVKQNRIKAEVARQGRIMSGYYQRGYNRVRFADRFKKLPSGQYGYYKGR
jgi:hypothetical protein